MAKSLRQIKNRIRSIESTRKVTRAMQMISVTKLNRMDDVFYASRNYCDRVEVMMNNMLTSDHSADSPLFEERIEKKNILLCLISADGGLCGTYNQSIIRMAEEFIQRMGKSRVRMVAVGTKGFTYFRKRGIPIVSSYAGLNGNFQEEVSEQIAQELTGHFISREFDEVYLAYTQFVSMLTYKPVIELFLPVVPSINESEAEDYLIEPDKKSLREELIPAYVSLITRVALLSSFTSEHAARTVAMKSATDNAKDLLEALVLQRNKIRQANITQDIMEIISSAEALKG